MSINQSSNKKYHLREPRDADSITALGLGSLNLANQQEGDRSHIVMHPCIQPTPVTNATQKSDGASNSGTFDKSASTKGKDEASKESNDDASVKQRSEGAIDSLVGITYQQKLSTPMVCQVSELIRRYKRLNFDITNEDKKGGLFDDIVFKSDDGDLFIQAKHKEAKSCVITWDDLTSTDKRAPFAISKYLNSFLEKEWDDREREKRLELVLCTNIGLHEEVKSTVTKYSFGANVVDSILKSITNDAYKIDLNILKEENKKQLLNYLKEDSELGTLAKLLAQHIFQGKTVDFRNNSVQKKYRPVIENKIAKKKSKAHESYEVNEEYFNENREFKRLFEHEYKLQQREQPIRDDIKKKGIYLEKSKPTKCEDKNNPKRIWNSDLDDLATQLAQHIFREIDIDFLIPLFKKYRYIIEKCIATDKKKGNGCYIVDDNFFNIPGFKDFKRLFDIEYQKLLKPEHLDIWTDVQNKSIRLKKEKQPDKCGKKELPKQLKDAQIEKFFKSFMIVCNTKHEEDQVVASILESEVLPVNLREQSPAAFTFYKVGTWILERMKDKSRTPIKRRDIEELFMYIESSLIFAQLKGLTNSNCSRLINFELQCKQKTLQQFKLYQNLHSLLAKVKDNENEEFNVDIDRYNYPSWVVPQIIQSFDSKVNFLFLEDAQFEPRKKQIMDGFRALKSSLILVIECKSSSNIAYIEAKVERMSTNTFKKIILIDQTCSASEAKTDLLFSDLTDQSKKKVFNQSEFISFFGTETPIGEVIHDEDKLNFVLDVRQLPSGTGIKFDKLKESYEKIKDMFIHRKWSQCECEEELWESSSWSSLVWCGRKKGTSLTKLFPGSEAQDKISYKIFLDYNNLDIEEYNRVLLNRKNKRWHRPGVDGNTKDQVQSNFSDLNKTDPKVHVIFNEAGSGKSFYLTWLASYLQDVRPSWWIIKFNLNEYSMEFDQLRKMDKSETMDELITIRFLLQLVYLVFHVENRLLVVSNEKSSYAQTIAEALVFSNGCLILDNNIMKTLSSEELILLRIFKHKFNSKQIVILMDGFDEIAPDYKTVVLKLLSMLKTFDGICKVYLSSRPYGLRTEVETTLEGCACYRLVEFNDENQCSFIHRYLLKHLDGYKSSDATKQVMTCRVIFAILEEILGNLLETPLFLSMGVELLMPMVENHINVEEETISKQIIAGCENSFELLGMVECFVEKKLNIVNIEKTGSTIAIAKTVEAMNYAKQKLEKVKETHSLLALYTILNKDDIEKILTNETQQAALRYMENVKNGLEKSGLIEGVSENTPIFNHRLFAEHFAALWFYSNQNNERIKDFLKPKEYETDDKIKIRQLLNRMICKNSPLHMAVLDGSTLKMDSILTKEPHLINARDEWGRTPLHLAISSRLLAMANLDIIEFLLDRVDKDCVNLKDTYFEWFTLDYAYCADITNTSSLLTHKENKKWHYVRTLLNIGASIDTPEMLFRFSKRSETVELLLVEVSLDRKCTSNFEKFFTKVVQVLGPKNVLNVMVSRYEYNQLFYHTQTRKQIVYPYRCVPTPILDVCIMFDSLMFKTLMENSNDSKLEQPNERHLTLAFRYRSINVLQYLIADRQQYLNLSAIKDNFEQELCVLHAYMQCDEQKFKSHFHDYCTRYKITCLEETPIDKSKKWNSEFSLPIIPTEQFPTEFAIRYGIDSGTEFLISRALQLDNASAVEYLLYKTKTNLDNHFIRQLCLHCKIKWCCLSSYHFLLDNNTDLTSTDENGRNLLHFAVGYDDLNLVKCMVEHYDFKPSEIIARANKWNAFFYCASYVASGVRYGHSKNMFAYLLEKDPVDCFGQLDAKGKSVFYYAAKRNKKIADYILQRKFKMELRDFNSDQISDLMKILKPSGFDLKDMLEYFYFLYLDDPKKCKSICDTLKSIEELQYHDEQGRNLLHIACMEGWLTLTKCLIEYYGFDAKEINEKENNWNAFFYFVCNSGNASNKLKIFTYLMEKDPFDCFGQLDSMGKSVFNHAMGIDKDVGMGILKRDCKLLEHLPIEERIPVSMEKLRKSGISIENIGKYLEEIHWMDEQSVKIICDYLKTTGELYYKDEEMGRNILHIACKAGLLTLTKCLIEHYGFDAKEINAKENNWNALFYCVSDWRNYVEVDDDDDDEDSIKLKIFTYLMEKDPFDCFGQLDSKGKSVFYYAMGKRKVRIEIFKRECKLQEHLPIEDRIPVLIEKLQNGGLNSHDKIDYFEQNHLIDEESIKIICDYLKTTGELNWKSNETSRNLLHFACMKGWLTLTKCLTEHYGFDAKETNEKENNWNAFFYCLIPWATDSNKLKVFTYLMEKDPFDCFGQLDFEEHNVFYYAMLNNVHVAEYIIRNDLPKNDSVSVIEWASRFTKRMLEAIPTKEIESCLMNWVRNSSLEAKFEICQEIRSNLDALLERMFAELPD